MPEKALENKSYEIKLANDLLKRFFPSSKISNQMNEFGFGPMLNHFVPIESARFNNNFILIVFPDFCKFRKFNFFCTVVVKLLCKVCQLHDVEN